MLALLRAAMSRPGPKSCMSVIRVIGAGAVAREAKGHSLAEKMLARDGVAECPGLIRRSGAATGC
ncbi:hypothetical protein RugamoR64_39980 [Duganella rhizosphaerae]